MAVCTSSRGISLLIAATRLVFASRRLRTGSHAAPPQFTPPMLPGKEIVPRKLGGVNRPSLRRASIFWRHHWRASAVAPHASDAVNFCGTIALHAGNGWLADESSPLMLLFGTARSSTVGRGSPVVRSRTTTFPILVGTPTALDTPN